MDRPTFKAEHPDVYDEVMAAGIAQGVTQEHERVEALSKWSDPACAAIVAKAITDGSSLVAATPELMGAMVGAAAENPPAIETDPPENGAGAEASAEGEDAEPEIGSDKWIKDAIARVPVA